MTPERLWFDPRANWVYDERKSPPVDAIKYIRADVVDSMLAAERAAMRERCAKVCAERVAYQRPIPCPDNKPGCCVLHSISATRDKTGPECASAIRALEDEACHAKGE